MREVRRVRAEAYAESRSRTPQQQRALEERLAKELGLELRPSRAGEHDLKRQKRRRA